MKNKIGLILLSGWLYVVLISISRADELGLGQMAANMMEPLGLFLHLVYTACFIVGSGFIFASIVKYLEHRESPLMVPISLVITLFISGILLLFLPFLSYLNGSGFLYVFTLLP